MTKQLTTFPFSGNNVRVLGMKIEPWFIAVDVLRVLGVHEKHMTRVINTLDDDEKKKIKLNEEYPTNLVGESKKMVANCGYHLTGDTTDYKTNPVAWIISEPGFYKIMFRSRNPIAKKFTRFVAHEVLPSIRRYGYYKLPKIRTPKTYSVGSNGEVMGKMALRAAAIDFGMSVSEFERTSKSVVANYVESKLREQKEAEEYEKYKNGEFPYTYSEVDKMCDGCLEDVRYALRGLYPEETFSVEVGGYLSGHEELFNEFFVSHVPEGMEVMFGEESLF